MYLFNYLYTKLFNNLVIDILHLSISVVSYLYIYLFIFRVKVQSVENKRTLQPV